MFSHVSVKVSCPICKKPVNHRVQSEHSKRVATSRKNGGHNGHTKSALYVAPRWEGQTSICSAQRVAKASARTLSNFGLWFFSGQPYLWQKWPINFKEILTIPNMNEQCTKEGLPVAFTKQKYLTTGHMWRLQINTSISFSLATTKPLQVWAFRNLQI